MGGRSRQGYHERRTRTTVRFAECETVDDVLDTGEQVHVVLLAWTQGESFDIVLGAALSGLEALRRLVRRWDPLSGGKRREHFCAKYWFQIGANCKIFPEGLKQGEELVHRYERSNSSGPMTADIKIAALNALVPSELEQHLALNCARLITYEQVRTQAYIGARQSQFAFKMIAPKNTSVQRMWTALAPEEANTREGKPKSGTGKGVGSLEQGDQAAAVKQQPQLAPASSLDLASFETLGSHRIWTWKVGVAISHFHWMQTLAQKRRRMHVSTNMLQVYSSPTMTACVHGTTECGYGVTFRSRKAHVHKCLISASKIHVAVVDSKGGYIIHL